jgi:hypothetical protein
MVIRGTFRLKGQAVTSDWRIYCTIMSCIILYSSPNINRIEESGGL